MRFIRNLEELDEATMGGFRQHEEGAEANWWLNVVRVRVAFIWGASLFCFTIVKSDADILQSYLKLDFLYR